MQKYVLVLNAGSSSLKFAVYRLAAAGPGPLDVRGQIDGIGRSARLSVVDGAGHSLTEQPLDGRVDNQSAFLELVRWLRSHYRGVRVAGVGHRVVHGGACHAEPALVTPAVLDNLRALVPLAPLHQPYNLAAIEAVSRALPDVPQVACFDTSFHRGRSTVTEIVPLPADVRARGVQRYGFHGLSYEYVASVLPAVAPDVALGRVIVAHLGSGASLCAMKNGRSVDTTFGFTALDGLCMGTRPGAIDPGVILYLAQVAGFAASDIEDVLYRRSGLLGISGISNDMRDLLVSSKPAARLAVDYFVYRAAKEIGALAAVLEGLDALVFTAGIGERSADIRQRICRASAWLGVEVDDDANEAMAPCICSSRSRVAVWVVPTNEELMIARHTTRVLAARNTDAPRELQSASH